MEKAVKETRAGKESKAENSFGESISKINIRFSFAKNPEKRAAANGASAKPSGRKKNAVCCPKKTSKLSVTDSVKEKCAVSKEDKRKKTAQRKTTVAIRARYSLLLIFASLKSKRRLGIL